MDGVRSGAKGRDFPLHGKAGISPKYLPCFSVPALQCLFYGLCEDVTDRGLVLIPPSDGSAFRRAAQFFPRISRIFCIIAFKSLFP